jgi:hypothetical protein
MAMAMCRRGRVLLGVHHRSPPTDEEWARWIALAIEPSPGGVRTIVESGGSSGPNAKQRRALAEALQGVDIRSAILTDSLVVRGIVTAIAWLNVSVRAFATEQQREAADYLELAADECEWAFAELQRLRVESGARAA